MRITYCVVGSRGDVQPVVGLCQALQRAGHEVRLFTHDVFEGLAREHGVEIAGIPGDPRAGLVRTAAVEMGNNRFPGSTSRSAWASRPSARSCSPPP